MIHAVTGLNLWDPTHVTGFTVVLTAFLLGLLHGVTPDEHTWPITFSYAIGSYSTKRGLRAGFIFSSAFTLQRALTSELAFLGLAGIFTIAWLDNGIYVVVGLLMALGGILIARGGDLLHLPLPHRRHHEGEPTSTAGVLADPRWWMPAVHGFVAGWGFGAFALIIYTVLAPAMGSAAWGWVPGAVYGAGTTLVQAVGGGAFGALMTRRRIGADAIRRIALVTAARTLAWGGLAFVAAGLFGLAFPGLADAHIETGLHVHNLDEIGLPLILVIVVVMGVGGTTLVSQIRSAGRAAKAQDRRGGTADAGAVNAGATAAGTVLSGVPAASPVGAVAARGGVPDPLSAAEGARPAPAEPQDGDRS